MHKIKPWHSYQIKLGGCVLQTEAYCTILSKSYEHSDRNGHYIGVRPVRRKI